MQITMKLSHLVVLALVILGIYYAWQKWGKGAVAGATE